MSLKGSLLQRMVAQPTYALVCTCHFIFLYKVHKGEVQCLASETRLEGLVQVLMAKKIRTLRIWDRTPNPFVKIEKSPSPLNFLDLLRWYRKKRRVILAQEAFALTRLMISTQSFLLAGTAKHTLLNQLEEKLKAHGIGFTFFHYSLELGHVLHKKCEEKLGKIENVLIVACNRSMEIHFWFYQNAKLSFARTCTPSPQQSMEQHLKSSVTETLRYLEKSIHAEKIINVFLGEVDMALKESFPKGHFFCQKALYDFLGNTAMENPDSLFDCIVLRESNPQYMLMPKGKAQWMGGYISLRIIPWIRMGSFMIIIWTLILVADNIRIFHKNHELTQRITNLKEALHKMQKKTHYPNLEPRQISMLQTLLQQTELQQDKFWQYLGALSHALGQRYVLRSLNLGPQQARLLIERLREDASFEELLERCQQNLSPIQSSKISQALSPSLVIEGMSPFSTEKLP